MPNNFKSHSIILRTAKTSSATRLSYTERPLDRAQARFVDRTVMDPELDLARFTCTAVIDWLDVLIMVQRPTQFQWLQEEIYRAVGRRCLVEPLEDDAFPKGTIYRIRFQEPRLATVWAAVDAVAARFGIQMVPPMMGMEVSVDFTPKEHSDELRRQLMGVLVRHHFPGMDVLATKRGRPRCAWGKNGNHRFVLPFSQKPGVNENHLRSNDNDRPAYVDACFYVGSNASRLMWRIMDKVVDSQNHAKGRRVDLPDEKKRVRIEVSLGLEELHDQGLEWLDDLEDFNFVRMQGRYFRFMRPTFADHGDGVEAGAVAGRYIENERRTKFWNTGVLGIQAQDGAIARERKKNRKELRSRLRQVGRRLKAESKMGKGGTGTLVAYEELNAKIEAALRHLGEKVRRG